VVGTEQIRRGLLDRRGTPGIVHLIEPPVDTDANTPAQPTAGFREAFGLVDDQIDLVIVSRLVPELKLEGILTAIDVVAALAAELPLRLVIVGDGPSRGEVEQRAAAANAAAGRRIVVVTGQLDDPRPAYASADIALGMGGSALRSLAFGKPLIVQGERGFFELLTPESSPVFLSQGWYGVGGRGAEGLAAILRELAADRARREDLGRFGRNLVTERFSLERAALVQEGIYREIMTAAPGGLAVRRDALTSVVRVAGHKVSRRYQRIRGSVARDDFNAVAPPRSGSAGRTDDPAGR
jgi:glycosyltransferase involved in cell wall biosynthesis